MQVEVEGVHFGVKAVKVEVEGRRSRLWCSLRLRGGRGGLRGVV